MLYMINNIRSYYIKGKNAIALQVKDFITLLDFYYVTSIIAFDFITLQAVITLW